MQGSPVVVPMPTSKNGASSAVESAGASVVELEPEVEPAVVATAVVPDDEAVVVLVPSSGGSTPVVGSRPVSSASAGVHAAASSKARERRRRIGVARIDDEDRRTGGERGGVCFSEMSEAATTIRVPYAEYLRLEQESATKHEWLGGEVFAMAGGSPEHARLQAALAGVLRGALQGRPCVVFGADLRIRSRETEIATYADASVVYGALETHPEDPDAVTNPVLVIEVLSPSTEAYDRGQKAAHYRRLPSMKEYVLVAQDGAPRIEVFRRAEGGRWELIEAGAGESLTLESVGCTIAVDEEFADPLARGRASS